MPIRYEGRYPDSDATLISKLWADDAVVAGTVTQTWLDGQIATAATNANLKTVSYVDEQDAQRATLAEVAAADALYVNATAKGVSVATLDAGGMVTAAQLPTVVTDRVARSVVGEAVFSGTLTATTTAPREKRLATVTITDPGFPYLPLPFGAVTAQSGETPALYAWTGTQLCGQLTVCPPEGSGDTIYGLGACSDTPTAAVYPILPYAASNTTPITRPPVKGDLTLDLYGCCFQGSGYQFSSTELSFYVLVIPAK